VKKYRFRRLGIGTGTKVQQANLRALAKEMAEDPGILIPECAGKCARCPVKKLESGLRKVQAYRKNHGALQKLTSRGGNLERAYAAMLMIALEETPIMFATAKLPTGDVGFTVRGKARKEFLIGLQHFDDPKLRLLAYSELAMKNKVHIYSSDENIICGGRTPHYPKELVSEVISGSNYTLARSQSGYGCEHAASGYALRVEIVSAGMTIQICRACSSQKTNILAELSSRVIARKPESDFRIALEHGIECKKGHDCTLSSSPVDSSGIVKRYRAGQLSDRGMIDEYEKTVREAFGRYGTAIFILGNTCYENDHAAFIKALGPSETEEAALTRVLKSAQCPVVMDSATPNAVLSLFWEKQGANAIHAVTGDKELARSFFLETKNSGKTPVQILREAALRSRSKEALSKLPEFKSLGKLGRYSDDIARTHRALGREEALKKVGSLQDDTKARSLNCGFLIAMGALKGKEWQFSKEEQDYGRYLADFAACLLNSKPEGYSDALQNLLSAAGTNESVG